VNPLVTNGRNAHKGDPVCSFWLLALMALFTFSLPFAGVSQVNHGTSYAVYITNRTSYVNLHFVSLPNKINFLEAAWVYPTNAIRTGYTNLTWSNLLTYPSLPQANHVPPVNDYSVTNRFTNRFRIYRLRAN
jgi:hypothetical protein